MNKVGEATGTSKDESIVAGDERIRIVNEREDENG